MNFLTFANQAVVIVSGLDAARVSFALLEKEQDL